jgi:hypothetical protein
MAAMSTGTVGFLLSVFGISFCIWVAGFAYEWIRLRNLRAALSKSLYLLVIDSVGVVLFLIIFVPVFVARTAYYDHAELRRSQQQNEAKIKGLQATVTFQQHNITSTEPVFFNLRDVLDAFAVYRTHLSLRKETCFIKVTAPKETAPLATVVATFSNVTSHCETFGPDFNDDPKENVAIMLDGVPDAIVLHAPKDDAEANLLATNMENRIKIIRRYDTPTIDGRRFDHVLWFQFGDKVKWNSEIR